MLDLDKTLVKSQLQREQRMLIDGREIFNERKDKTKPSQQNNPNKVIDEALGRTKDAIDQMISKELERKKGRPSVWLEHIKNIDPNVLAKIALSVLMDGQRAMTPMTSLYKSIGELVEIENIKYCLEQEKQRLNDLEKLKNPKVKVTSPKKFINNLHKTIIKKHDRSHQREKALRFFTERLGIKLIDWDSDLKVHVGGCLVKEVLRVSEVFDVWDKEDHKGHTRKMPGLLPNISTQLDDADLKDSWIRPRKDVMECPPDHWSNFADGGYLSQEIKALTPIVKHASYSQVKAVENQCKAGKEKADWMKAVNVIQATPFTVNEFTLKALTWVWENNVHIPKLGTKEKFNISYSKEEIKDLSKNERQVIFNNLKKSRMKNREIDGLTSQMSQDLRTATEFLDRDFWMPFTTDPRGRTYPESSFNYQRDDARKSLFLFSNKEPLDGGGLYWLMVHIATTGDFDKMSKATFDERVAWVEDNEDAVIQIGLDYENTVDLWKTADKPFQFLAACNTYTSYHFNKDFECGLPISLDGSSSGTQHFSAASRSEKDGKLVNLIPSNEPQDLYGAICKVVRKELERIIKEHIPVINRDDDGNLIPDLTVFYAKAWLNPVTVNIKGKEVVVYTGLTRGILKRNVMTYGYSSQKYGFADQLFEDTIKKIDDLVLRNQIDKNPFGETPFGQRKAAEFLAAINYDAVSSVLSSVNSGMSFFRKLVGALAHEGKHFKFKNQVGFPMHQKYTHWNVKKVRIFLFDRETKIYKRSQVSVRLDSKQKVDKKKSKSAISANIIHSCDSAHLLATVIAMHKKGCNDFFMIHDSFGCLPNQCNKMFDTVRETFVNQYENYCLYTDVLNQVKKQLSDEGIKKLDVEIPEKGNLDLRAIMESDYCFS